jgi:RES domain
MSMSELHELTAITSLPAGARVFKLGAESVAIVLPRTVDDATREEFERVVEALVPPDVLSSPEVVEQARRNAAARTEFLRELPTAGGAEVADLAGSRAANRASLAHTWRKAGRIFAITVNGAARYPLFQFDAQGRPLPVVARVLTHLRELGSSDWEIALWFTARLASLGDRSPAGADRRGPGGGRRGGRSDGRLPVLGPPPDPSDPLPDTWAAGLPIQRVHPGRYAPNEFNPTASSGRCRPFRDKHGVIVPGLYGGIDHAGALAESVFHDVPVRGPRKRVGLSSIRAGTMCLSTVVPTRDLTLASAHGLGLTRLGMTRRDLIETRRYAPTAAWGQAFCDDDREWDGIVWMSRQADSSRAVLLFGGRVQPAELPPSGPPLPLWLGQGLLVLYAVATAADIDIVS